MDLDKSGPDKASPAQTKMNNFAPKPPKKVVKIMNKHFYSYRISVSSCVFSFEYFLIPLSVFGYLESVKSRHIGYILLLILLWLAVCPILYVCFQIFRWYNIKMTQRICIIIVNLNDVMTCDVSIIISKGFGFQKFNIGIQLLTPMLWHEVITS